MTPSTTATIGTAMNSRDLMDRPYLTIPAQPAQINRPG